MRSFFHNLISNTSGGVYVIAEACDNHMGSLDMAKALANMAKKAGADAVKFQHHIAEEEMLKIGEMSENFKEHLFEFLERNSLTLQQHVLLKNYCDDIGITYLCTPFNLVAAQEIADLVPFIKIGSGEFSDYWFIDNLINLGKPIVFSSGMSSYSEIEENVNYFKEKEIDFAILNCLSEYPPRIEDLNLRVITKMIKDFPDLVIGHSDHTDSIYSCISAVTLGAKIIEKHITLSGFIEGPDKDVSLTFESLKKLVHSCKDVNITMGDQRIVNENEEAVRKWAYRSVVSAGEIQAGEIIKKEHLKTKRPTGGIPSCEYENVIGKIATKKINSNVQIKYSDIKDKK